MVKKLLAIDPTAEKVQILQKKNPQNSIFNQFSKFLYQNVGKTIGYG